MLALREFEDGETGPVQWAASGHVRISRLLEGWDRVVRLCVADGWHVNSPKTEKGLVPTRLEMDKPVRGWQLS